MTAICHTACQSFLSKNPKISSQTTRDRNKSDKRSDSPFWIKCKTAWNDYSLFCVIEVKDFLVRVCTRIIRECKLRSPSWIIGPRRVLLKHRRQWNRTKCICVTIGDLCELFRAGTTPVTSGRCESNRKWEYGGTGATVYMRIHRVLHKKRILIVPLYIN